MINSVSFCGGSQASAYQSNNKKSVEKPCKYAGAAIGVGIAAASAVKQRAVITNAMNDAIAQGLSKGVAKCSLGVGFLLGAGIIAGVGAFAGKMIGKAIDHFRKPAEKSEVA